MKLMNLFICMCYVSMLGAQSLSQKGSFGEQYSFDVTDSVKGILTLINSHEYCIELAYTPYDPYSSDRLNGDITLMSYLSYGDYNQQKEGYIVLQDKLFGNKLEAIISDSSIEFQFSDFVFLKDRSKTKYRKASKQKIILPPLKRRKECISILKTSRISIDTIPFYTHGPYKSGDFYELMLGKGNTYQWSLFSLPISQGIWERQGNVLNFYDQNTKQVYHAIIESSEQIRCVFMPGNYYETILQFMPEIKL